MLATLEAADAHPENYDGGAPTFVVVGGGATGVETAGALMELLALAIRQDRLRIDPVRSRVILIDGGDRLLAGFSPALGRYAAETLARAGVIVRLDVAVQEVTADGVRLANGEYIGAAVVVWAAGVTVDGTLAGAMAVARGRGGRVTVEQDLSLRGHPEVFVIGDAAAVPRGPEKPQPCPATGPGGHPVRSARRRPDPATSKPGRPTDPSPIRTKG